MTKDRILLYDTFVCYPVIVCIDRLHFVTALDWRHLYKIINYVYC